MTVGERVWAIRKANDMTLNQFGARIGMGASSISDIENGRRALTKQTFLSICREFNVREAWLRTGQGDMFVRRSPEDELADAVERLITGESAEFKRRLITALAGLSEEHWLLLEAKLREIVGEKTSAAEQDEDVDRDVENYRRRRVLEKNQAAGLSPSSEDGAETA